MMDDLRFPDTLLVTDQEIDVSAMSDGQRTLYVEVFKDLVLGYQGRGKDRSIVGLAGPTGSGKSVIAALFKHFAQQITLPFYFETLGIDAFHFANDVLSSRKVGDKTLKDWKGRYDTYDMKKLVAALGDFAAGKEVILPIYSRTKHDPVENAIVIGEPKVLLLLEGLWLLRDSDGWEKVAPLCDERIFLDADKSKVREMVIARHVRGGRSPEEAAAYYDTVDAANFDLVMTTKIRADRVLPPYYEL